MLVADLIKQQKYNNVLVDSIKSECSNYIEEGYKSLLTKYLPKTYSDIQKVKVRIHKEKTILDSVFNVAFEDYQPRLLQRSIITNTKKLTIENTLDEFCVFPINGYKFLYNKEIVNSNVNITNTITTLNNTMINTSTCELVVDLLKSTYSSNSLYEGIKSHSEIIIYNIPYYYVIRKNKLKHFNL